MNVSALRKWCDAYEDACNDPNLGSKKLAYLIWKLGSLTTEITIQFQICGNTRYIQDLKDYGPDIICPDVVKWYNQF